MLTVQHKLHAYRREENEESLYHSLAISTTRIAYKTAMDGYARKKLSEDTNKCWRLLRWWIWGYEVSR